MRKLFSLLLVALLIGGVAFAQTPSLPYNGQVIGTGGLKSDPHRTFRLVRYVPPSGWSPSLTAESIVIWDTTSDDGVTVTVTSTSFDSRVAGIMVVETKTPDTYATNSATNDRRNWGWLQTYGLAEVRMEPSSTAVAGDALAASATQGEATVFIPTTTTASTQGNAGFFYDNAAAAADNIEVFLRCE